MSKTISIIGGGIGGLATAILLAKDGHKVSVYEKNECRGRRAGIFKAEGFTFDMGPSWYLMPDLFEKFFKEIDEDIHDWLQLERLSPSYRVFWETLRPTGTSTLKGHRDLIREGNIYFQDGHQKKTFSPGQGGCHEVTGRLQHLDVYSDIEVMASQFETMEPGAGEQFRKFLKSSGQQYPIAMEFASKNYDSIFDFFSLDIAWKGLKLNIWTTIDRYVARFFKTSIIQKIMQYTTVFLGTAPSATPAFYNIMSHVDFAMGVWYPKGGLHAIATALHQIGLKYGVEYFLEHELIQVESAKSKVENIYIRHKREEKKVISDHYIINADQARFETIMLAPAQQTYSKPYREKKTFAPSGFIMYVGISKKLENLKHHNLYFNEDWAKSFGEIFEKKVLPEDPSLYMCVPSKTDNSVAPDGMENMFVLVPIPNGIEITLEQGEAYREKVRDYIENMAGESIRDHIVYEKIFDVHDFAERYHARNGNAIGLAHSIMQTACFRPNNYSKKLDNLFYVGHTTNPGCGVPMVIVSAMLVYERMKTQGKI